VLPEDHVVVDADQGTLKFLPKRGGRTHDGKSAA